MKLGILTLPLWNNYGGILQCYSLNKVLNDNCIETLLIDYQHPKANVFNRFKIKVKYVIKNTILRQHNIQVYPTFKENFKISEHTLIFIRKFISPKTRYISNKQELESINELVDGVVVGSDQVWRPNYTPNITAYFLDFLRSDKLKIAYSASFGTEQWLFTEAQTIKCKELLDDFDFISVRETSGIKLVEEKFDGKALKLLDPTLLLHKKDYQALIQPPEIFEERKLFTYILDEDEFTKGFVNKAANLLDLTAFKVMPKKFDKNYKNNKSAYVFPEVEKWISAFDECDFVITDSFHGCVFSIIFNKPFIAIGNKERGLTRFTSLLKMFGLSKRLVLKGDDYNDNMFFDKFDWDKVNQIHEKLRSESLSSLLGAINGK